MVSRSMKLKLVSLFRDGHKTLDEISEGEGMGKDALREILVGNIGRNAYLATARRNGGFRCFDGLRASAARFDAYCSTMSKTVRGSLQSRMKCGEYRRAWLKKARYGSKLGVLAIRKRMRTPGFSRDWSVKCAKGGVEVVRRKIGIHDPQLRPERVLWSLKGLRRTSRKVVGPNGEKMYNDLENRIARALKANGVGYVYEKRFAVDSLNGFVSVDFVVGRNIFIEATCWDKPHGKCMLLNKKFALLKTRFKNARFIVVTTPHLLPEYARNLGNDIKVCGKNQLVRLLLSKAG